MTCIKHSFYATSLYIVARKLCLINTMTFYGKPSIILPQFSCSDKCSHSVHGNYTALYIIRTCDCWFISSIYCASASVPLKIQRYTRQKRVHYYCYYYYKKGKKKGKGAYSSSWNSPQNYGTPLVKWDHSVICYPTEVAAPPSPQPSRLVLDLSTP